MKKQQTAITQVHLYIKEHFVKGESFTSAVLTKKLKHLTPASITAALWKLTEEGIIERNWNVTPYEYAVTNDTFCTRESESRGAPSEHHRHHRHQAPRRRVSKKQLVKKPTSDRTSEKEAEAYASLRFDEILADIEDKRTQIAELTNDIDDLKAEAEELIDNL